MQVITYPQERLSQNTPKTPSTSNPIHSKIALKSDASTHPIILTYLIPSNH